MLNILLIVQIIISLLLIGIILIQKTGSDSLSGLSGGGNMGIMSARGAANFLTNTTIILATLFVINSIILANLSSKEAKNRHQVTQKIEEQIQESEDKNSGKAGTEQEQSAPKVK